MSVEATSSTSSAPICLTPADDDPPKVDDKKSAEKKQLDQNAAANTPAPATVKRDVEVFVARFKPDGAAARAEAAETGKDLLKLGCAGASGLVTLGVGAKLGMNGVALEAAAVGVGYFGGKSCMPVGTLLGGKAYDAVTGGPNTITFEKQTVQVEVPVTPTKADAAKPATSDAASAPAGAQSKAAAKSAEPAKAPPTTSKPSGAAPAPNASTLPATPAPASSAWTDPTARYLRPAAAKN